MRVVSVISLVLLLVLSLIIMGTANYGTSLAQTGGYSLRFLGYGFNDLGRVKIPIHPHRPADIGGDPTRPSESGDFTIEFWIKASPGANTSGTCTEGTDTWINGNIIIDRDLFGNLSYGDYGVSLYGNKIAFGVNNGSSATTICGGTFVANGFWRHIAVTRQASTGNMRIFIDGTQVAQATGPTGNLSYDDTRSISNLCGSGGNQPCNNEPFIVLGAEKHDYDPATYPPYNGFFDELRISNTVRYSANFTRPSAPFTTDANTVALYHFDEGVGNSIADSSGNANTATRFANDQTNTGPNWAIDVPFGGILPTSTPPSYWRITISHNELFNRLHP
ncbi:MAG: LamG domain-containing protein, partial [Anaerolineae bacterium]|nr:LamG domain-containing protein [Anaerolineae bacterium]